MKISNQVFSSFLVYQISPLDQHIILKCNKEFNKSIIHAIDKYLVSFYCLNPWFSHMDRIEAQMLLQFNALMVNFLYSSLNIKDQFQFVEFLFNSQNYLLANQKEEKQINDIEYENLMNNKNAKVYEKVKFHNQKLLLKYEKLDTSNGIYIGQFNSSDLSLLSKENNEEEIIKSFELFMEQLCNRKIIYQFVHSQIMNLNKIEEFDKNLNIIKITQKSLIRSNNLTNIILANKMIKNWIESINRFDYYSIVSQSDLLEIQYYLNKKQNLKIIDQIEQFQFDTKSQRSYIPLIFSIFESEDNLQLEDMSSLLRQQFKKEQEKMNYRNNYFKILVQISVMLRSLLDQREEYIFELLDIIEKTNIDFKGFKYVQYQMKLLKQLDNKNNFEKANHIKEFFDNYIDSFEQELFKGLINNINLLDEQNKYILDNNLVSIYGQICNFSQFNSNDTIQIQSQFCYDLVKVSFYDNDLVINQPYLCLYCKIITLNIQLIILVNKKAKMTDLQNILLKLLFKSEYISKNLIQQESYYDSISNIDNLFNNKNYGQRNIIVNCKDEIFDQDYEVNYNIMQFNYSERQMIHSNKNDEFEINKQIIEINKISDIKWINKFEIESINQKDDQQIINGYRQKVIYEFFENNKKVFDNQIKIHHHDKRYIYSFDYHKKYINERLFNK